MLRPVKPDTERAPIFFFSFLLFVWSWSSFCYSPKVLGHFIFVPEILWRRRRYCFSGSAPNPRANNPRLDASVIECSQKKKKKKKKSEREELPCPACWTGIVPHTPLGQQSRRRRPRGLQHRHVPEKLHCQGRLVKVDAIICRAALNGRRPMTRKV